MDIDAFEEKFDRRFRRKKQYNAALCLLIFLLGTTAFIYKADYQGGVLTCFREMTVSGTVFTSLVSLLMLFISLRELKTGREATARQLYYLRLSSTVTEFIIFFITLLGYLPFVPAAPVILRYDMMNMHVLIPIFTLLSFAFNDAPRGRLRPVEYTGGLIFLLLYSIGILTCILTGVVPEKDIPYFFLNVRHQPVWASILYCITVYAIGYGLSVVIAAINKKLSWRWFR